MSRLMERIKAGFNDWPDLIEDRPLVVSVSGGKDSTAMALWLIEQGLQERCSWVFADTGWEHPSVYEYLDMLEGRIGKINRVTSEKYPRGMVDLVKHKGFFPSRKFRFCTEQLKVKPIHEFVGRFIAEHGEQPINCVGIRADESPSRAKMDTWDTGGPLNLDTWRPIITWGVQNVVDIHTRHGIVPCSLYLRDKHPSKRVGCYPCIMSRKKEIMAVAENDSWRIDEIRKLEKEAQEKYKARNPNWEEDGLQLPTMFQGRQADADGKRPMTEIDKVVEWAKTSHGGNQIELFYTEAPGCQMWGLCDLGGDKDED